MSRPSRQPVKADDDAQLACAAQQGGALVGHVGTQARTTFAAPGDSGRRKAMPKSVKLLSFGLLAVVAVAAGDLIAAGRATAAPQELTLTEHAATDAVTDTGASGDSAGDILTFANEVFDAEDINRLGSDQGMCVRTVPGQEWEGGSWECFWTLSLASGQITVEGPFYDTGDSVLAITGGTGAFANAQGDMLLSPIGTEGKAYRFTYKLQ
jgi:Allene oxide cyclase